MLGGSSEDGYELEGTSEGEVGADLEDGIDRDDEVADIMGARARAPDQADYITDDEVADIIPLACSHYLCRAHHSGCQSKLVNAVLKDKHLPGATCTAPVDLLLGLTKGSMKVAVPVAWGLRH